MKTNGKTLFLTQFAILLALEALFCFTVLGSLPAIGPIVATLGMVPVIITAIMLGTKAGAVMGAFAGLFSFIVWTFMPPPQSVLIAFVFTPFYSVGEIQGNFWSIVICFVPRIMVGVVTGASFRALSKAFPNKDLLRYGLSGFLGSLANTLLVMGGIYLFFGDAYASVLGKAIFIIIGSTILTSGIPEAIIGGATGYIICKPLKKALAQRTA